jgi:hypothetical protein
MSEQEKDFVWILAMFGVLTVGHLLHSWMIARLHEDVKFAVAAASAVQRETESS